MSEWQPIETAPKRGERTLLVDSAGIVRLGYWSEPEIYGEDLPPDCWVEENTGEVIHDPSRWMLLPDPDDEGEGAPIYLTREQLMALQREKNRMQAESLRALRPCAT